MLKSLHIVNSYAKQIIGIFAVVSFIFILDIPQIQLTSLEVVEQYAYMGLVGSMALYYAFLTIQQTFFSWNKG